MLDNADEQQGRSGQHRDQTRSPDQRHSPAHDAKGAWPSTWAALTFLILALLVLGVSLWASADAGRIGGERFAFKAHEAQFAIRQRLLAYEQALRGGVALFAATKAAVTRDVWRDYVAGLAVDQNYPGIQGIGFAKRIAPDELTAYIAQVHKEGFADFAIRPAGERAEYTSIIFLEPFDWRNQRAFGVDMFSEPVRHKAMMRARDQGQPAMSGKVTLVQETDKEVQSGFLIYLPVYSPDEEIATAEERGAALLGYVYAPFRARDLMQGILSPDQFANIRLEVFDGPAVAANALLYDSMSDLEGQSHVSAFVEKQQLETDGRIWTIRYSSRQPFDASIDRQTPQLILFGGLVVSLLAAAIIWALSTNSERARHLAEINDHLHDEIAERTRLTAELACAKNAAETANHAKSVFLANMSHELRTPLNAALGYAQMLADHPNLTEWQTAAINTIRQSGEYLLMLISDILDISKIEAGKFELMTAPVALTELLEGIADAIRLKAEEKDLTFVFDRSDELLPWVHADERCLRQILLNLLGNAVKFTDRGQVTFRVKCISTGPDNVLVRFDVEDTGVGIPSEKLDAIFEPFEQVSDRRRRSAGTGLGLAITRNLIEMMGRGIDAESTLGVGSRFSFELDLATAKAEGVDAAGMGLATGYLGPCRRILVADDTQANRMLLSDALTRCGFEVQQANNGEEALAQLSAPQPDLILMDVMMPIMDGLEATRRLRARPDCLRIPVIAISASVADEDRVRALGAGVDAFLGKPVDLRQLFAQIGTLLNLHWIKDERGPERDDDAGQIMLPPADHMVELLELARAGNMQRVKAWANELAARDDSCRPFANRLLQLAAAFDSAGLLALAMINNRTKGAF